MRSLLFNNKRVELLIIKGFFVQRVAFDLNGADRIVQARALSTQSGVPGAIHRASEDLPGGFATVITQPDTLAQLTDRVYVSS